MSICSFRECINRVCDEASLQTPKKRRVEKRIQQCIANNTCMEHSGTNVILNISSRCLELTSHDTGELVAKHDMPSISFASGGDAVSTIVSNTAQFLSIFSTSRILLTL